MGGIRQPCMDCGAPADGTRCPRHTAQHTQQKNRLQTTRRQGGRGYGPGWKQRAALVRATATLCHICGQPARPNDPWQADHIIPVQHGGTNGPVAAAHRSCNIAKGNRTRHEQPNTTQSRNTGGRRTTRTPNAPTDTHPTPAAG